MKGMLGEKYVNLTRRWTHELKINNDDGKPLAGFIHMSVSECFRLDEETFSGLCPPSPFGLQTNNLWTATIHDAYLTIRSAETYLEKSKIV